MHKVGVLNHLRQPCFLVAYCVAHDGPDKCNSSSFSSHEKAVQLNA